MDHQLSAHLERLPGSELILQGVEDVAAHRSTIAGELVKIGSPRLKACGIKVDVTPEDALDADRRLYRLLATLHGNAAHSQYNALIRQLVSFERALEGEIARTAKANVAVAIKS